MVCRYSDDGKDGGSVGEMELFMREYPEDDGRTVADMSGVERPALFGRMHRKVFRSRSGNGRTGADRPDPLQGEENGEKKTAKRYDHTSSQLEPEEYFAAVFGAVSAALLVGLVFLGAAAALIAAMFYFW